MRTILFKFLPFVSLFLSFSLSVPAQNLVVKGLVTDGMQNEAMIGVTVSVEGTSIGTSTDKDGTFTVKAQVGQTILFSFMGYKNEVVIVNRSNPYLNIELLPDNQVLEEIVVVGYGQQKKTSSVGSIGTAKGEDLVKAGSVTSISEALQGQMAGVVSINTNSKPGSDAANIFIRGKATWGTAGPLVLVDGIERDFNDVDVNEVESLSVLKDASATAVYGVKGANGVILLTTKRGNNNNQPSVSFSANLGFKQPTTEYKWADYLTSMKMYNEAVANDRQWDKLIPESTFSAWENAYATGNYGPYNDYFPEVDWWKQVVKDYGVQQNYNMNIRGGSSAVNYFLSFGYLNDGDIFNIKKNDEYDPRFNYQRYNWRANLDFKLTKTTLLTVNIAGKMGYRNQPGYRDPDGGDSYIFAPLIKSPTNLFPIQYSDGFWGSDNTGDGNAYAQMNYQGQRKYTSAQGFYDVVLKQDLGMITKGLSFKGSLSYTTAQSKQSSIFKAMIYGIPASESSRNALIRYYRTYDYSNPIVNADGSISYPIVQNMIFPNEQTEPDRPVGTEYDVFQRHTRELYYEFALNYARSFNGHNVTALALFNRRISNSSSGNSVQFPYYEEDWVGRVTYNWKERYLLEANAAYTGSEKFAPGKRFGFFPSVSVGWRLSEEPFMKSLCGRWLNNFKIRYSYGQVGSDRGAARFNYIQLFSSGGNVKFGMDQDINFGPIYTEGALAYANATWETATKQNLGIEMTVLHNLMVTVDLFQENRDGILMKRNTVAPWIGKELPSVNIGQTKNHGLEIELSYMDNIGKDFTYFTKFTFATSENRVVFRDDPQKLDDYLKAAGKPIGYQSKYIVSGNFNSIDDIFNYTTSGINNGLKNTLVPGDFAYIDYNCDGLINDKDQVPMKYLSYPLTTYSLSLGFTYKGIGFNALLYAATEVYREQINQFLWDFPNMNIKAQPNTLERWTTADAYSNTIVRPSVHLVNDYNSKGNTYSYVDHSYLRLKNLEINYQFPKRWLKSMQIGSLQVYVNANNLITFSSIDNRRDPETENQNVYPIIRRYNTGIRVSF